MIPGERRGTRAAAVLAGLVGVGLAAAGCAGFYAESVRVAYLDGGRPHPAYYCADCHGVAYFDPYYDVCLEYGYFFDWRYQPDVRRVWRRDYVAIRRAYPNVGRFHYRPRYREEVRARFGDERGRLPVYREGGPREDRGQKGPRNRQGDKGDSPGSDRDRREKDGTEGGTKSGSSERWR